MDWSKAERLIFHIDVNSAFLSWTSVKRLQNGESDLRLVPSVISGDPDKRTSIVAAKSIPAKAYGIETGESIVTAMKKCPGLVIAGSDFAFYKKCSADFIQLCREYAPVVQQFSIDECFLDMSGTHLIYPDPVATAHEIKDKVRDTLGFTVNVGIGSNKLLAKMASDFTKPDRVHILMQEDIPEKMWPLPVGDLFSVGKSTAVKLKTYGIYTIGELAHTDEQVLISLLGDKMGRHVLAFANGIDDSPVVEESREAKSYGHTITLEADVTTREDALPILRDLAEVVSRRMRKDHMKAYCVTVTIRGSDFKDQSHQRQLMFATDGTNEVYETAVRLFDELWKGKPFRLLGIALGNLTRDTEEQLSLFSDENKEKSQKLDNTLDIIMDKYGRASIGRGSRLGTGQRIGRRFDTDEEK